MRPSFDPNWSNALKAPVNNMDTVTAAMLESADGPSTLTATGQTVTKRSTHDHSCQHIPDLTSTRDCLQSGHRNSQDWVNMIWNRGEHGRLSNVTMADRAYLSSLSSEQTVCTCGERHSSHPCCPPAGGSLCSIPKGSFALFAIPLHQNCLAAPCKYVS